MITKEEYRNIMTDVYRKIITAVNIETGDDGSKAHEVLKVFHELLRMDEKQYKSQRLQATSGKLQAPSSKLDKTGI
jgi:hypothetical protein